MGISEDAYQRQVHFQTGVSHLRNLATISSKMVSHREAEAKFRQENEQLEVEAAFFNHTNYIPLVQLEDEALRQHYTNDLSQYRLGERRQVSYLKFEATNYLDHAEVEFIKLPVEKQKTILQGYWREGSTDLDSLATAQITNLINLSSQIHTLRTNDYKNLETNAATQKIRLEILTAKQGTNRAALASLALIEATKAGYQFQTELNKLQKDQPAMDNLEKLALLKSLTPGISPPLESGATTVPGVQGLSVEDVFKKLSEKNPLPPGTRTDNYFLVASLKKILPSRQKTFEEVKTSVTSSFKKDKAIELMKDAGTKFNEALKEGIKAGKTFDAVCRENNLTTTNLPPFKSSSGFISGLNNRAKEEDVRTQALALEEKGSISDFIPSSTDSQTFDHECGFVLSLVERKPVDQKTLDEGFSEFLKGQRRGNAFVGYDDWIQSKQAAIHRYSLDFHVKDGGSIQITSITSRGGKELPTPKGDDLRNFIPPGARVKMKAKPESGYRFEKWPDDYPDLVTVAGGDRSEAEIDMDRNRSLSAIFIQEKTTTPAN